MAFVTTTNLDAGTKSPRAGRAQIYDAVERVNEFECHLRGSIMRHIPRGQWSAILAGSSTYDCTTAIQSWLSELVAEDVVGLVPDGRYIWNGGIISHSGLRIRGWSRPRLNAARTALVGGARFVGTLRFNGAEVDLENIGVDRGAVAFPASPGDALVLSGLSVGTYARLENVIGLGRAADDAFHAILVEGYEHADISSIVGCRTWYGNALKLKKGLVRGVRGYENAISGCILRSNSGDGVCEDLIVDGVITDGRGIAASGDGGTDYGFYVVVDNQARRIRCSNIVSRNAKQTIAWRTNANLTELSIVNATVSNCESGFTGLAGAGDLYGAQLTNCSAVDCTAWALRVEKAVTLQVDGFFGMGVAGTAYRDELMRIESPVLDFQCDNVNLTENYSSTRGGIRLLSAATANTLGNNLRAIPWGNVPSPGLSESTQTGFVITLTPIYSPSLRHTIVSQRGGSAGTVTTIGREYSPGATRFPVGSLLTVKNDDTQPLTIPSTAANVVTKGGANIVIAASGIADFRFDGANWVEA